MRHPFWKTVAAAWLAVLVTVATNASAVTVLTKEGEHYSTNAGECGGESVRVVDNDVASNGQALELPNTACWSEYSVLLAVATDELFVGSGAPTGGASGETECVVWDVKVDGTLVGSTPEHCNPNGGTGILWAQLEVGNNVGVALGSHIIRVTTRITQGPDYANSYVDYLAFATL